MLELAWIDHHVFINDVWERPFNFKSIVEFCVTPENGVVERLLLPWLVAPLFVPEYVANKDGREYWTIPYI